jgi:prophage antirepressor-like protein
MNDFKKDRAMLDHEGQATGGQSETLPVEFKFQDHSVRTLMNNGEARFVHNDVCAALGIANPSDALSRLDEDEKGVAFAETPGGPQEMNVITEFGLYRLILRSNKPKAKAFQRWLIHDVLPAIRKTGRFEAVQQEPQPEIDISVQLIKRMLSEPGRYRLNVFPDAKPYIYKTDIDFILKEDDQLNCQLLGRFIQTIFTLWEKLKIEQSVFHELRDDIVVTNLETSIRQAERLATHFLRIYDKHSHASS